MSQPPPAKTTHAGFGAGSSSCARARHGLPWLAVLACAGAPASVAAQTCEIGRAELVVVEGAVDVRESAGSPWQPARNLDVVCVGYEILVSAYGRATIVLPDGTKMRAAPGSHLIVLEPEDQDGFWMSLVRGVLHIIGRDPRELGFATPYANAGLEGTEFLIEADDVQTVITVIEGRVVMSNEHGALSVPSGSRAIATGSAAPISTPVADPFESTRWTPHSTRILDGALVPADGAPSAARPAGADFYLERAASRLALGKLIEAEGDIARAVVLDGPQAKAQALNAMIALARGDKAAARRFALAATDLDPEAAVAWLATSHAERARFEFEAALESAARAVELAPDSAAARVRLAEASLAEGDYRRAVAAAEQARRLDPALGHVDTVVGFARLAASDTAGAMTAFERAVAAEPTSPWARIGLALTLIGDKRLDEGREQLEIAVIHDPSNPILRSYMARTYAELGRLELNDSQLELASALDPDDPTPYVYGALVDQLNNRPIQGLQSLGRAIELNDNRAVQRSQLRLDEDLAVRSGGVGRLYNEVDFVGVGLGAAWKASVADRTDHSPHGVLADLYATQPRHEWARVSELFQAQLLEPIKTAPVPSQLAEANLFILSRLGPADLSSSELRPLVRRDGLSLHASAVSAGNDTEGVDVALAGLHERVSFSLGFFELQTDGFRANNDLDTQVANALVQFRPTPDTSVLFELRRVDTAKGMLQMFFDRANFDPDIRHDESVESLRFGARHNLSPHSTLLGAVILEDQFGSVQTALGSLETVRNGATVDVQHLLERDRWQLTSGLRRLDQDEDGLLSFVLPLPGPPFELEVTDRTTRAAEHTSLYAYADIALGERVTATVGASADDISTSATNADRINPKIGLLFEPTSRTTVRASALRTLEGPSVSRHSLQPRLEPTHVAGFNQSFFGAEGDRTERYGVALDHGFSDRLYAGVELAWRDVESQILFGQAGLPDRTVERDETLRRAYLYWTPSDEVSIATEYRYDEFDGNGEPSLNDRVSDVETHRLAVSLNHFGPGRLKFGATGTYVNQRGVFWPFVFDPAVAVGEHGEDTFWLVDLSVGYRLPNRRGLVALQLDNAFDREFNFQDTDPENQTLMPERMLSLRFTLAY